MTRLLLACLVLISLAAFGQQSKHDALNDAEIDKIRDSAKMPDIRLKLYIEFARARLEKLQQAKTDTTAADREDRIKDALQDFVDIYDELDNNVDTFADRGDDIRKALKPVIEADTEFGSRLRAFRSSLASSRTEAGKFDFLAGTALQAVDDGAKEHRDVLAEQEEKFKNKKEKPHKEERAQGE